MLEDETNPNQVALPTQQEILGVLKRHKLVRFNEEVIQAFVVGSFAKGTQNDQSDLDILLEVVPREGYSSSQLEDHYRQGLRQYFVTHRIEGKCDAVHPQWEGRRVDLFLTYDLSQEMGARILLAPPEPKRRRSIQP